jgi:hypothetical protein
MPSSRKSQARESKHSKTKKIKGSRNNATYQRALGLLSDLRRGVGSYGELLRKHRLHGRTAHKYLGRDLISGTRGKRVRASRADRRVRELMFPKPFGDVLVRTRSSRDATKLSEFFHDREELLNNELNVQEFEAKWRGVHVAGQELFADAAEIFRMANAAALKLEDLYGSTGGAR